MSQDTDYDALYESFMKTLDKVNLCPYCGHAKEEGDPCCGEVHDETCYDNGDEYIQEDELDRAFERWCAANEAAQAHPEPEYESED